MYFISLDRIWKYETKIIHSHEIEKVVNINLSDEPSSFVLIKSKKQNVCSNIYSLKLLLISHIHFTVS